MDVASSNRLLVAAKCKGVRPSLSRASKSAPILAIAPIASATTSVSSMWSLASSSAEELFRNNSCNGVRPDLFRASSIAPAFTSALMFSMECERALTDVQYEPDDWTALAALCKGVPPHSSTAAMLAPLESNTVTILVSPPPAARCKDVPWSQPSKDNLASTSAPAFRRAWSASGLSLYTALCRGVAPSSSRASIFFPALRQRAMSMADARSKKVLVSARWPLQSVHPLQSRDRKYAAR